MKEKIPHMCESIGRRPLWGRCPKKVGTWESGKAGKRDRWKVEGELKTTKADEGRLVQFYDRVVGAKEDEEGRVQWVFQEVEGVLRIRGSLLREKR